MHKYLLVTFLIASMQVLKGQIAYPDNKQFGNNKDAGHYIKLRGINMYYESYGRGEPLLFLHFNGGSISAFTYNIPFFAKRFRVIAVDSRAQGKTIDNGDSLTF